MDWRMAAVTVSAALPDTPLTVAEIVAAVLLAVWPWASPPVPTVATEVFDDDQVAVAVTSCVLLLLKVATALNCWVRPAATDAVPGVTAIEERVGAELLLHPANSATNATTTDDRATDRRLFMGEVSIFFGNLNCA